MPEPVVPRTAIERVTAQVATLEALVSVVRQLAGY
jgi:hypothetical protein